MEFDDSYDDKVMREFIQSQHYAEMDKVRVMIERYFNVNKDVYVDNTMLMGKIMDIFNTVGGSKINRCIMCNIDIGECNPRQLCGKTYCASY